MHWEDRVSFDIIKLVFTTDVLKKRLETNSLDNGCIYDSFSLLNIKYCLDLS